VPSPEGEKTVRRWDLCRFFFGRGGLVFLLGVLAKTGVKTWCSGGEFVVVCVVKVVVLQP
jgi:hypothetical protein